MLKREVLELCLLHLLAGQDRYGYEILRLLNDRFPDVWESAIYAILRGMCKDGLLEAYTGTVSEGPVRKYYRMKEPGQKRFNSLLEDWRALKGAVEELGIR